MPLSLSLTPPPTATTLRRAGVALLDLLFPPRCVICQRGGTLLCSSCIAEFVPAVGERCPHCWQPGRPPCLRCQDRPPAFASLRTVFVYSGALRDAILAVKYRGYYAAAGRLIDLVDLPGIARDCEVVVPVPMPGRRRRTRGFNQAQVIAARLASRLDLPCHPHALRRLRASPQQSRQPDLEARRANVQGAFSADPARVRGCHVLVVDDIATSGATLDACAKALLAAGAASVHAWAIAHEG